MPSGRWTLKRRSRVFPRRSRGRTSNDNSAHREFRLLRVGRASSPTVVAVVTTSSSKSNRGIELLPAARRQKAAITDCMMMGERQLSRIFRSAHRRAKARRTKRPGAGDIEISLPGKKEPCASHFSMTEVASRAARIPLYTVIPKMPSRKSLT